MLEHLQTALARLRKDEAGIALPTVLMMLVAGMAIASVAAVASINAQSGTTFDKRSKDALGAAEAGANQALLRYNRVPITTAKPCIVPSTGGALTTEATLASPAGWCRAVTGSVGSQTFSYQIKPNLTAGTLEVVSTGTATGVSRRIEITATGSGTTGTSPFANASVIGRDYVYVDADSTVGANVATNGYIELRDRAKLCGNAQVPTGTADIRRGNINNGTYNNSYGGANCNNVGGQTSVGTSTMPTVTAPTTNSNGRLFGQDTYTGQQPNWSASARTLLLNSGTTLTLSGTAAPYLFCSINLNSGSTIYIAPGVRVYFDSPESCGQGAGTTQLNINANSYISATGTPANVAFLFVGSDSRDTRINLSSNTTLSQNCNNGFVIVAPKSSMFLNSDSKYCGAVLAKSVWLNSRSSIYRDDQADEVDLGTGGTASGFKSTKFVECTPTNTSATPDASC